MFRRIFAALTIPAILFGITAIVIAVPGEPCDGYWCAGASVNRNRSHNRANASVGGGSLSAGTNVSYTLTCYAGPTAPEEGYTVSGSYEGNDYVSHSHRQAFTTDTPSASAEANGEDKHGNTYYATDSAPSP